MAFRFIRHFWSRFYAALTKFNADDGMTWAASLSYYAAFSIFPLVLVLLAGLGLYRTFGCRLQARELGCCN